MSSTALIWSLLPHEGPTDAELRTLSILADYAHPDGRCAFPSVETIAKRRGLSARTVQRHLGALRDHGLIAPGDQGFVAHLPANKRPTVWDLCMDVTPAADIPDGPAWDPGPVDNRGDTVIHRGDISLPTGVTSDVTQTKNLTTTTNPPSVVEVTPTRASWSAVDDAECEHGDPRPRLCPLCRAAGLVPAPGRRGRPGLVARSPYPTAPDPRALAAGEARR